MSDIFLKCPAWCNATVSHSSKRGAHLGQHLTGHQRVLSAWSGAGKNVHLAHLNLTWGSCTWWSRCNYLPYPLPPCSHTWRGTVAGTWKINRKLAYQSMRSVLDIHLHSYLSARLLGDLMALKETRVKSRLSVFVKATFPCLGCFWHSVVGTWWHLRSGT